MQLYSQYCDGMYIVAKRFVKDADDAEDVVQECFIKAFEKIYQLENEANLGGWIKRIVVNKSLDVARNKNKIQFTTDTTFLENEPLEEDFIEQHISIDFIKECINKLKEKYRVILVLYMIEDYNHREIGELLKINESTVRNQYRRGKNQLLQLLKVKQTG